jgi:hypothetical protein
MKTARERFDALVLRNSYLHSLLPFDFSEPPDDSQLADGELIDLEIQVNARRMLELLEACD